MTRSRYPHLLSPITINGVTLRNRIIATCSNPHFVQGSETWPTDGLIMHYANKARVGRRLLPARPISPKWWLIRMIRISTSPFQPTSTTSHRWRRLCNYYGAKASMLAQPPIALTEGWDASTGMPSEMVEGDGSVVRLGKEAPEDVLVKVAEAYAEHAYLPAG